MPRRNAWPTAVTPYRDPTPLSKTRGIRRGSGPNRRLYNVPEDPGEDEYLSALIRSHPFSQLAEWRLMVGVAEDGIRKAVQYAQYWPKWTTLRAPVCEELLEPVIWVFSPGNGHLYDFESVMDYIHLD